MNALTLLKKDHAKVKALLSELESTTERGVQTRQRLFAEIKAELTVHETIEEEIFYPELKAHPKAKVMQENIEHHIEEEEGEMFDKAEQVFDQTELEDLGRRMAERKESVTASLSSEAR